MENPKTTPASAGIDWAASGYSAAAKSLQVLAEEIAHMSARSFEQNAKLVDDLRNAHSVEDVFSIQTKFMAGMFESFNEHVRIMGARMAELRNGMTVASEDMARAAGVVAPFASAVDAEPARAPQTTHPASETSEHIESNLKASADVTRSAFVAAGRSMPPGADPWSGGSAGPVAFSERANDAD